MENDCDTLENEANRLLTINKDLRANMLSGNGKISDELGITRNTSENDQSFAAEMEESEIETSNLERPGPEGPDEKNLISRWALEPPSTLLGIFRKIIF